MPSAFPTVSVIVPAHNAAPHLRECLISLRNLKYPADRFEVVVVDNNSTDETPAIARDVGFEPLACARPGPAAARNLGIRQTRGEIVVFIDSDAVADPDWLVHLMKPFDDPNVGGVGGRIAPCRRITGPEIHATIRGVLDQKQYAAGLPPYMLPFVATVNAAYRASILKELGGFDEEFTIGEDADLAWRAQWAGWELAYVEEARVRHYNRPDRASYLSQACQYGRGGAHLFAKHRRRLGFRVWIEWRNFPSMGLALARIPIALVAGRNGWERVAPMYDLAVGACWLAGRVAESLKRRVIVI